ncbi:SCO7613 C-terminal domain-containing membrane protein [Parafrigoribacterium soli]|uniref:SCO7613 C-terminal domain-containing membrane protein n=1 Tax=Parafrigoribacterium soli TaxID=3144663 RepID=UPI0032EE281A
MADTDADFTRYAGRVSFPRTPDDLTNTAICPACLHPLTSRVCAVCALDLNHPAAAELFQVSTDAAAVLKSRISLIGRIRFETARLIEQQAAERGADAAISVPAAFPAPTLPLATSPAPAAAAAALTPDRGAPRRSSVQLVMLIVGVSLLSIAAIFFLVFAFITYGLLVRSLIIGGITIAAIVTSSVLNSRRLHSTAEGIAVFAAILVYLDAFAVRANDLAGLASAESASYWGTALVASAVAFVLWHRASGLRVPNVVGFAALAPGLGLLVGGLAVGLDTPARYFAAFAAAGAAGLAHPFARTAVTSVARHTEVVVLLTMSSFALVCASFTAFVVQPQNESAAAIALIMVALIGAAEVVITVRVATSLLARAFAAVASSIGAVAAAMTGTAVSMRMGESETLLFWPVLVATIVALALEALARRAARTPYSVAAVTAAISAGAVAALGLVIAAGLAIAVALGLASSGPANPWSMAAWRTAAERSTLFELTLAGLALVVALTAASWAAAGLLRRRGPILLWAFGALVVLAVPLLESLWLIVSGWFLVAIIALLLLIASGRTVNARGTLRLPIAAAGAAAAALAYSASWLSIDSWGAATLASILLLIGARFVPDAAARIPRAALLGCAAILAIVGAAALAHQLGGDASSWHSSINALRFVGILGVLLLGAALLPAPAAPESGASLSALDRRVLFWLAAPTTLISSGAAAIALNDRSSETTASGLLLPEHGTSLILALMVLAVLLPWATGARAASLRAERALASLAIAPVTYWVVDSFATTAQLPQDSRHATPIVASLLVAVGSLVVAVRRGNSSSRWFRELGIAVVAVPGVLFTVIGGDLIAWFVLLIAAVTALILAVSPDGLFASTSRRRHLGWLAVVLATAGLWLRLSNERVTAIEAYVLPVAAVLLVVGALIWNSARSRGTHSTVAPLVCLGGLLVAILPIAAESATGPVLRAYLIGVISAMLLLVATFSARSGGLRPYLAAVALAGALGVLVTSIGRSYFLVVEGGTADGRLEFWIGSCLVILTAAAFGVVRSDADTPRAVRARELASRILVVVAMTVVLAFEAANLASTGLGLARAFLTLVLFLAIYLTGALRGRAPLDGAVGWIALGYAAAIGFLAIVTGAIDPLEFATVPIALALIADGAVRLAEDPRVRSWAALGPGLAVLLVPSLLASAEDRPLWRLVGLGVVAVSVLIAGAVRRLQAPFIVGAVVALVHGIATFSTEIRIAYESLPWWLWLGIGGVLLIAIAARYERRIKNLRDVALRIASLR